MQSTASVVLLLFVLLLSPLMCMGALVIYEYDMSDTTCSGTPVLSYAIPTTCTSWPLPNYPPQYLIATCSAATNTFSYVQTTNDATCRGSLSPVSGLNTCIYDPTTPNFRGSYAPFKRACSEAPIATPSPVAVYSLSDSSNCTNVYYQINIYKPIPSGSNSVCVNGDSYACGSNGITYSSFAAKDCSSGLSVTGLIPYGYCNSITWPSLIYPVKIGYSGQKCQGFTSASMMPSANRAIIMFIFGMCVFAFGI